MEGRSRRGRSELDYEKTNKDYSTLTLTTLGTLSANIADMRLMIRRCQQNWLD
jgi:hypothetical protein